MPTRTSSSEPTSAAYGGEGERFAYQLIPQAPLELRDVEDAGAAIEVMIVWGGGSVLHVAHLTPPRSFYLGEGPDIDFVIGEETLGSSRLPLVLESEGELRVTVPHDANAEIEHEAGGERITLEQLEQQHQLGRVESVVGARSISLRRGCIVRVMQGDFTFTVRRVAAAQRVATARSGEPVLSRSRWTVASAVVHVALLGLFYFLPPGSAALSMDRLDTDSRLVRYAIEARENKIEEAPTWLEGSGEASGGARAADDEGEAGAPNKPRTRRRMDVAAPPNDDAPAVSREEAALRARESGIIGMLRKSAATSPSTGFNAARAHDSEVSDAIGALLTNTIGPSGGTGGLGMIGTGRGGGGDAAGSVGTGIVGTRGRAGDGDGTGYGAGEGIGSYRRRAERVPRIRTGTVDLQGSLSKETIRRVINRHINEIRFCYESQLITRPDLQGRVSIKFVISPTGTVAKAIVAQSDVGSSKVDSCIAGAVGRMDFPAPAGGGLVLVTYPFLLSQAGQ